MTSHNLSLPMNGREKGGRPPLKWQTGAEPMDSAPVLSSNPEPSGRKD